MNMDDLYAKFFKDVYVYVFSLTKNKHLTEDIVQETFTRAYINIKSIQDTTLKAWLLTVSRNIFYDYLRKQKHISTVDHEKISIVDKELLPEDQIISSEKKEFIQKEVNKLSPKYRQAIDLYHFKNLSYKNSASKMNVTVSNFKSILFRARRNLKKILESKGDQFGK